MRRLFCVSVFALAGFSAAALADGHSEIVTAAMHAGLAAKADDIAGVHTHLHHTLNCLVGPYGGGFDKHEMNPCANAGSGAIDDTHSKPLRNKLEEAADKVHAGLMQKDLAKAQQDASQAEAMLKALE